jgi:UDP-2,3-diacylglucosamine hydrolase
VEFIQFLKRFPAPEFDRIICLGDLFDFWFEYKHVAFSGYFEVLRTFAELRDAGLELHLICGNHDFWGGRFLRDELGFTIHPDGVLLPFGDQTAYLVHGDGVNETDWRYRLYKRIARNSLVVGGFRLLHPDWAMAIAQGVSHSSRTLLGVANPAEGPEAQALRAYAKGLLAQGKADVVMCGHAHAPTLEEHPGPKGAGLYINTGDWLLHRSHVVWDNAGFHLHGTEHGGPSPAGEGIADG